MSDSYEKFDVKTKKTYKIFIAVATPILIALGIYDFTTLLAGEDNVFAIFSIIFIFVSAYYFLKFFIIKLHFENDIINYRAWYGKKYTYKLTEISKVETTAKNNYSYIKIYNREGNIVSKLESGMDNLDRLTKVLKKADIKFI